MFPPLIDNTLELVSIILESSKVISPTSLSTTSEGGFKSTKSLEHYSPALHGVGGKSDFPKTALV
jgi:hypothetical protein